MKKILLFLAVTFSTASYSQLTDSNFRNAINTCLTTNPEDGMCTDSEYGAMPDWDVSQVTDMSSAFEDRNVFNGDLSSWNVSSVTDMDAMFFLASAFNQDITAWDVSNVTIMSGMFYGALDFNQPLNDWDTSKVTDMGFMFDSASAFNQNIGDWDVSNVTDMSSMFGFATSFNQDISNWCVTNIASEPSDFSTDSLLSESNKPVWGSCPTASVDDQNQLDISIYPNPTSDIVYVEGNYTQLKVIIYNVLGKEILNKSITNSIDISHLDNGVYILQLSDGVKLSTRKIIKN